MAMRRDHCADPAADGEATTTDPQSGHLCSRLKSVVTMAIAMPIMRADCRRARGNGREPRAPDKQHACDEIRGRRGWRSSRRHFFSFSYTREHALGDEEAAEDIDRAQHEAGEPQPLKSRLVRHCGHSNGISAPTTMTEMAW
jgi:hypothetical protein